MSTYDKYAGIADIGGPVNVNRINNSIERLVRNDVFAGGSAQSPKIWECRWYNVDKSRISSYGYGIGDAVWINTERTSDFVQAREEDIREYALGNPKTSGLVSGLSSSIDRERLLEVYSQMVNGENGYERLYYLGDVTKDVQIRISLSDNNTHLPSDDAYWKDFIRRDLNDEYYGEQMLSCLESQLETQFAEHVKRYHLGEIADSDGNPIGTGYLSRNYLLNDMSNASVKQQFKDHQYTHGMAGLDFVSKHVLKRYGNGCCKWFRMWNSGLLEHGGILDKRRCYELEDSTQAYDDIYDVNLGWDTGDGDAPTYDYPTIRLGYFYDVDRQFDTMNGYGEQTYVNSDDAVDKTFRYTVSVTPKDDIEEAGRHYGNVNQESERYVYYHTTDITNINNSGFSVNVTNCNVFQYYTRGFTRVL